MACYSPVEPSLLLLRGQNTAITGLSAAFGGCISSESATRGDLKYAGRVTGVG